MDRMPKPRLPERRLTKKVILPERRLTKKVIQYPIEIMEKCLRYYCDYDLFFNPNICHVCKSRNDGNLISCTGCHLVSYCSKQHRKRHYKKSHREICKILKKSFSDTPQINGAMECWSEWIKSRRELLDKVKRIIESELKRSMTECETEMILWPKACFVCYRQSDLGTCERCFSVNYCPEHHQIFPEVHPKHDPKYVDCIKWKMLLNINIERMLGECNVCYDKLFVHSKMSIGKGMESMDLFIRQYVLIPTKCIYYKSADHVLMDYLSKPLTIYSGLEKSKILETLTREMIPEFIIHIIGIDRVDRDSLQAWEVFFHLSHKFRSIVIVFIGPELDIEPGNIERGKITICPVKICDTCERRKKKLSFVFISWKYHSYLQKSSNNYQQPNIIVGYVTEKFKWHTSWETIYAIRTRKCPLFLCCSDKSVGKDTMKEMKSVWEHLDTPILKETSLFHSFMPYKSIEFGCVSFPYKYIIIYRFNSSDRPNKSGDKSDKVDNE